MEAQVVNWLSNSRHSQNPMLTKCVVFRSCSSEPYLKGLLNGHGMTFEASLVAFFGRGAL